MTSIRVRASAPYDVTIGPGASRSAPEFVRGTLRGVRRVAVVSDSNVDRLHSAAVCEGFAAAGLGTERFVFPAGERSKTLATYGELMGFLAARRLDRADAVVALGGGVAGDLAGFAAATYRRGVALVQIPTSLLAMVDSSVGGKTGVDLPCGKNLVGAFHQPAAVFCDTDFLSTLPDEWRVDGMGEVLKYAVLGDGGLFSALEGDPLAAAGERVIAECVGIKRRMVEEDERERGARKLLNLGHTFAHAIETLSGYSVSHGRAVATGVAMAARLAMRTGALPRAEQERVEALALAMGYEVRAPFPPGEIAAAALADKKVFGDRIDLVVPHGIGRCRVESVLLSVLGKVVERAM